LEPAGLKRALGRQLAASRQAAEIGQQQLAHKTDYQGTQRSPQRNPLDTKNRRSATCEGFACVDGWPYHVVVAY
jgi:hypothetical protein